MKVTNKYKNMKLFRTIHYKHFLLNRYQTVKPIVRIPTNLYIYILILIKKIKQVRFKSFSSTDVDKIYYN